MLIKDLVYRSVEIDEPVLVELINSKPLQRIKGVNQAGVQLVEPERTTSRYDHCVGVMLLLRNFGASLEEQIAGLLHDVPHTAFSHAIDFVFKQGEIQTYHERFLQKIVFESEIPQILEKYKIDPKFVTNEHNFSLLEQDIPALCADRIDYSLRGDYTNSKDNKEWTRSILSAITTLNGKFVMTDQKIAYQYAKEFMRLCLELFNAPRTLAIFETMGELFREAISKKVISEDDFFLTDLELLKKVSRSKDSSIQTLLAKLTPDFKYVLNEDTYDYETRGKARYIDPLILNAGQTKLLSELEPNFASEIEGFKVKVKKGHKIKIV